ncbi:hypothetical_protein [Candidozyma auris]|uniref:hypothetical_protein n=1 Tax=Candidozyma auris TaxID=498019 RepID=UPI000D27F1BE|nr:hypothetical_protein [[Candida] auris]QEO19244.1 hypothetical_protein [[Candida] auris]GBL50776.1 putative membrane protein [[Candida] auris]
MLSPLLITVWIANLVLASPGDNLDEFNDCRFQCEQLTCYYNPYYLLQDQFEEELKSAGEYKRYEPSWHFTSGKLSLPMKILQWDCPANCDYQCQQIITKERVAAGEEVLQFHGKWPFWRIFGVQEVASMLFSFLNLIPHYLGYHQISECIKKLPSEQMAFLRGPFRNVKFAAFVAIGAWLSSTIFHIRDVMFTEKLDYYFAGLTVLTGFYGIAFRYFKLYLPSRVIYKYFFLLTCVGAYAAHIYRLETDWSYTYNMQTNIFVGILQNIFWGLTCFELYTKYYDLEKAESNVIILDHLHYIRSNRIILGSFYAKSPKLYSLYPLLLCFIVILGMSLEIFDFPPIFFDLVDAHSLWHLVTFFPAFFGWYDWMVWDISKNVWDDVAPVAEKKNQ